MTVREIMRDLCCEIFDKMTTCYNESIEEFKKKNNIDAFYFEELCKFNMVLLSSLIEKHLSMIGDAALLEKQSRKVDMETHNKQLLMIKNMFANDLFLTLDKCFKPLGEEILEH